MDMQTYLGKLDHLLADYNNLRPFTSDAETFYLQCNQYFMVLALAGLPHDLDSVGNQILSAPSVPTYDMVSEQLLRLSTLHVFGQSEAFLNWEHQLSEVRSDHYYLIIRISNQLESSIYKVEW